MARNPRGRQIKKNIVIFTEGETEKNYFELLNSKYKVSPKTVAIKHVQKQGKALLKSALNSLKHSKNPGVGYIIFDKDDLTNRDIEEILKEVKDNNIKIGYSNSCFEVWLVSHFLKVNHSYDKKRLFKVLEEQLDCKQYEKRHKNDLKLLKKLEDYVSEAIKNTSAMPELSQPQISTVPYTNIGKIIQEIYQRDVY